MYSPPDDAALPAPGFPIRRSAGQRLFSASPRLIAAVHVLHRLLVPRHPPCALTILTVSTLARTQMSARARLTLLALVQFSSSAENDWRGSPASRSLKTEQHAGPSCPEGRLEPPGPVDVSGHAHVGATPCAPPEGRGVVELPRKEVIQPQLPLRLPCYDFTPITSPTFDGSLPCGLGHRLRVLPAFVV